MLALASVLLAALMIVGAVFWIGPFGPKAPEATPRWQIVVTGASTEARPALPAEVRPQLEAAALRDGTVEVLTADGDGTVDVTPISLAPMRGKEPERADREQVAQLNVNDLNSFVQQVAATAPGHNVFAGIQEAARRGEDGDPVLIISNMLDTQNPLALQESGLDVDPAAVVEHLRDTEELPDLSGRTVFLVQSPVAGTQPSLNEPARRHLEALWRSILEAAGADVHVVASSAQQPPLATVPVPEVPFPPSIPPPGPDGVCTTIDLPTGLLFEANNPRLLNETHAEADLRQLATTITAGCNVNLVGRTSLFDADFELSTARATAIKELLLHLGVPDNRFLSVKGVGNTAPLVMPPDSPANRVVTAELSPRQP